MICYVDKNLNNSITNFYDNSYPYDKNDSCYKEIIKFDDNIDKKDINKNKQVEGKLYRYYLDNGVVKERTQEELESTPEYKEKKLNELLAKQKEIQALKEVKKSNPELSDLIDAKLAKLEA